MSDESKTAFVEACRRPFPPDQIGKLPRVTCPDCSKKRCQKHHKAKCRECGAWVSTAHIHLDFVGHAETTARLLELDPVWSWEPFALDEDGLPKLTAQGANTALWINLTVQGITRPGVGTEASNHPELLKILVGDAIRNAAMRFGVALDLWSKAENLGSFDDDTEPVSKARRGAGRGSGSDDRRQPSGASPAASTPASGDSGESPRDAMLRRFLHLPSKESVAAKRALEVLPRPSNPDEMCWPLQALERDDDVARAIDELDLLGVPA